MAAIDKRLPDRLSWKRLRLAFRLTNKNVKIKKKGKVSPDFGKMFKNVIARLISVMLIIFLPEFLTLCIRI